MVRILRIAHPPAHLRPMRVAAELSRTANAQLRLRPKDPDADGAAQLRDEAGRVVKRNLGMGLLVSIGERLRLDQRGEERERVRERERGAMGAQTCWRAYGANLQHLQRETRETAL